jgi:hypothetical protein
MVLVALIMLVMWTFKPYTPFMILGWSLVIGSSISIFVREAIAPSSEARFNKIAAVLFLCISLYGFAYVMTFF